jgi:poly(A) polymerase
MVLKKIKALLARETKRLRPRNRRTRPTRAAEAAPPSRRRSSGPEVVHHPVALGPDPDAVRIVKRLTRFNYPAYLVGGCVRDLLLEINPKDFDIATAATPRQVKRLFSNCRIIGRRFRLAHVYFQNGKIIEVATFRARDAADGAPEVVEAEGESIAAGCGTTCSSAMTTWARRRWRALGRLHDQRAFRLNAETVIDHADGLGDLPALCARSRPGRRFREDPIRILRAIKFAARLGFAIEDKTLAALRQTRSEIPKAAAPRILEEFNRFCRSGAGRRAFELTFETGVFEVIVPELAGTYREDGPERKVLYALLDAIDARWKDGRDVYPGEIFAALLFASVAAGLGLPLDPARPGKRDGRDDRTLVDDALRPMALRLRIARKDQEHVRQMLTMLRRMVPFKPMRRGARLALLRRPAFGNAVAMLDALAPALGGEFVAAKVAWAEAAAAPGGVAAPGVAEGFEATDAHEATRPRRPPQEAAESRRGRRGGPAVGGRASARPSQARAERGSGPPARRRRTPAASIAAARAPASSGVGRQLFFAAFPPSRRMSPSKTRLTVAVTAEASCR